MNALSSSSSESRYLFHKLSVSSIQETSTPTTYFDGSSANRALISVFFCTVRSNLRICRRSSCTVGSPDPCPQIVSTSYGSLRLGTYHIVLCSSKQIQNLLRKRPINKAHARTQAECTHLLRLICPSAKESPLFIPGISLKRLIPIPIHIHSLIAVHLSRFPL